MTAVAAGWLTSGCGTMTERITGPTSGNSTDRVPVDPPASATCQAAKAQWAVGEGASDALLERARIAAQAASARFLRPNQPITMEYLGSRLNLGLDEREVVASVSCG
jgi:peptidase inhibitor I78 family protein